MVLDLEGASGMDQQSYVRPKQFEARWLQEEEEEVMQRVTEACISASLAQRPTAVHQDLHRWDREVLKAPHRWRSNDGEVRNLLGPV